MLPVQSRALAIMQLFRFQNKKLEKARKKKEEKKEAMLEKSLFQGGSGAAGWLERHPAPAAWGEVGVSGAACPGELLRHTSACFSLVDTVAFGEVVTQPPTITSRPKGRGPAEQVSCGVVMPRAPRSCPRVPAALGWTWLVSPPLGWKSGLEGQWWPQPAGDSFLEPGPGFFILSSSLTCPVSARRLDGSGSS